MNISFLPQIIKQRKALFIVAASSLFLSACNGSNDKVELPEPIMPVNYSYEVSVTNLTAAQPMSPVAVVLHNEQHFWQIGTSASVALEHLAESGDNSQFLAESAVLAMASGTGVIMPSASETVTVTLTDTQPQLITVASMLVNTNDAFTGIDAMDLSSLAVGESVSVMTMTYDAGTEKNSEMMGTIPGPAAGGEGFNSERDDVDVVSMHAGVVTQDDGLSTSALTLAHRFDNPTLSVTIKRVE